MKRSAMRMAGLLLTMCLVLPVLSSPANAEVEIKGNLGGLDKLSIGGEINLFYRFDKNPYFGADITAEEGPDTDYGETFSKFFVTGEKNIGWATVQGQFGFYYAETIGQDFYAAVKDEQKDGIDQAWIKFNKVFDSPFDVTVGRQDIRIEKWFVMADGESQGISYWLYMHDSFPFALRVDGDFGALKTNLFWARSGRYGKIWAEGGKDDVEVAGINLHYDFSDDFYIYGGLYQKQEDPVEKGGVTLENDTLAYDFGFDATMGGLLLEGEVVFETGDAGEIAGRTRDRESYGGFASATYSFEANYSPYVCLTYVYFSGDDDPNDDDVEAYDPMFYDFKSWNRWVIGELVGEAQLPNTNKESYIFEVGFRPVEKVKVQLMYIIHELVEENYMNRPLTSTDWGDEVNVLIGCPINKNLYIHTGFGYVAPGDAAKEAFGDDDDAYFCQAWLVFSF